MSNAKFIEGARLKLEEAAIKYARMKTMGRVLENGHDTVYNQHDAKDQADYYLRCLGLAAVDLLAEMTNTPLPPSLQTQRQASMEVAS